MAKQVRDRLADEEKAWPFMVLCRYGCDQIGVMRFRLRKDAVAAAQWMSVRLFMTCIAYSRKGKEFIRFRDGRQVENPHALQEG